VTPQVGELEVAHVLAVDADAPLAGVVEARHEVRERGLAAARVADQRDSAAGRDREGHAAQHRTVAVAEPDAVEVDCAEGARGQVGAGLRCARRALRRAGAAERTRVGLLVHLERRVEDLVDPLPAGDRPLRETGEPADHPCRRDQHHQVAVEGDQGAEAEPAVDHLPAAVVEEERDREVGDEGDQRDVDGPRARRRHARLEHPVAPVAEPRELVVLACEDPHDPAADHVLLGRGGHVRDALLHVFEDGVEPPAEAQGHQQEERQERQREQRQPPVHDHEDHGDGGHHRDVGHEEHEAVAEEHAHVLDVAHGPAHELACRPAVEVGERLAQEVGPHPVAQIVLDGEAHLAAGETAAHADREAYGGDAEEGEPVGHQQSGPASQQRVVDGQLDDAWHHQAEAHLGEGEDEAQRRQPLVAAEELEDAPDGVHLALSLP